MLETINTDLKVLIFQILGPLFLIGFVLLGEFVAKRLPPQYLSGWKMFRIGSVIAALGVLVVAYFSTVEVGAAFAFVGTLLCVIGMIKLFVTMFANSKD
jgi:pheromone shutdown protein TraB